MPHWWYTVTTLLIRALKYLLTFLMRSGLGIWTHCRFASCSIVCNIFFSFRRTYLQHKTNMITGLINDQHEHMVYLFWFKKKMYSVKLKPICSVVLHNFSDIRWYINGCIHTQSVITINPKFRVSANVAFLNIQMLL